MDAEARLLELINGFQVSQALHVAAVLGLSDRLAEGPSTVADLAAATKSDERSLGRLLAALATVGVYERQPDGRYVSTDLGDALTAERLADWATFAGGIAMWHAWGALEHSVRTGQSAFTAAHGDDVWRYRASHPEEGARFDAAMAALSRRVGAAVLEAYDFSGCATVADVGGGRGALLAAILARYPAMKGILFDQPHVVEKAPVTPRCEPIGGDLFTPFPFRADAYLLKSILHDWPDDAAVKILENCRRSMGPDAIVLLLERVLTPTARSAAFSDLNMLVSPGGQERSAEDYDGLLRRAGLYLARVVPTATEVSIVEARIASA